VATPFDNSLRYTTRSNPQGLVYSFPEPEKVYRRRINRLAPRRLLESLGEEAISDIHLLFAHNNPTTFCFPFCFLLCLMLLVCLE
jgi:hypothetical protein